LPNDAYSNLLECLVVQLPPVVVSHTQYTDVRQLLLPVGDN